MRVAEIERAGLVLEAPPPPGCRAGEAAIVVLREQLDEGERVDDAEAAELACRCVNVEKETSGDGTLEPSVRGSLRRHRTYVRTWRSDPSAAAPHRAEPWWRDDELQTLCRPCHGRKGATAA